MALTISTILTLLGSLLAGGLPGVTPAFSQLVNSVNVQAFAGSVDAVPAGNSPATAGLSGSPYVVADLDQDGDVDDDDLRLFVACVTGPMVPYEPTNLPPGCTLRPDLEHRIGADLDRDGDVDQSDLGLFQRCYSGAGYPADPSCNNVIAPRITQIQPTDGTLVRDSVAYQPSASRQSLDAYPANARRTDTVLAIAPSDGVLRTKDALIGGGTVDRLLVAAVAGGYIWSFCENRQQLYRSADGDNWEIAYTFPAAVGSVWAIQDDDHPIVQLSYAVKESNPSVNVTRSSVWYWNGDDWAEATYQVQENGNWVAWTKGVGPPRPSWSLGCTQAPHGTLILNGTGGAPADLAGLIAGHHAQEIWRSVDRGRTWRRVLRWDYALKDERGNYLWPVITHMHAVGYHAGTHRWIVDTGDDASIDPRTNAKVNRRYWMISDDDGLTWKDYMTGGPYPVTESHQVVHWHDYGDPEYLAFASDWVLRGSTVSMVTFEYRQLIDPRPEFHDQGSPYFSTITQHNGWWLALSADSTPAGTDTQAIWVSPDGVHWAVYHEFGFAAGIYVVSHFAGEINGKLHITVYMQDRTYRHFVISPPRGQLVDAVTISPGRVNLLGLTQSQCEITNGLSLGLGTTASLVTRPRMEGRGALRSTRTGGSSSLQLYPVKTEEGKSYQASMWLRGGHNLKYAWVLFPSSQSAGQVHVGLPKDQWVRVVTGVWTETAKGGALRMPKVIGCGATPDETELFVDGYEVVEASQAGPWQVGGTAQQPEILTRDVTLSADWTYVLGLYSFGNSAEFAPNTTFEIARLQVGANDYIRLIYDTADLKFKLAIKRSGDLNETVAGTKSNWFHRGSTFRFIVRHTSTGRVRATLLGAKGVEDFCDLVDSARTPMGGSSQIMMGSSACQFSGMMFGEQWLNAVLDDAEESALWSIP